MAEKLDRWLARAEAGAKAADSPAAPSGGMNGKVCARSKLTSALCTVSV
jgi:hypothetical protein